MASCGYGVGCQAADVLAFAASAVTGPVGDSARTIGTAHPLFWPLTAGLAGAVVASLSGLVADRLPRMLGWNGEPDRRLSLSHPPSRCDSCGKRIPPLALVPVAGWLAAGGRCGECFASVPAIYPVVEGCTAVASMAVVVVLGPTFAALCGCLLLWALVLASWIDWRERLIPDGFTVPMFFSGLLLSPFEPDVWARGFGAVLAMGLAWVAFKVVSAAKDVDAMAVGDVALAGAAGAWLGACAVPGFLIMTCAAYVAYALPLRLRYGQVWVPMGPALGIGTMLAVLTGWRLAL